MPDNDGFEKWPPKDLVKEIEDKWKEQPGRSGKHWAVKVDGNNPISGYKVILKKE